MSKAYEQAIDNEMSQQETFVRFGDVENGNYTQFNEDGTQEIFVNFVSQGTNNGKFDEKYFSNRSIGQSVINKIIAGRNSTLGMIGDSTGASGYPSGVFSQFAYQLGELNTAKIVYSRFNNTTNQEFFVDAVYGKIPETAEEENGILFNGGDNGTLIKSDNGQWDSDDLTIDFRISKYNTSKSGVYVVSKWGGTDAEKSFYIRLDGSSILFTWMTSSATQKTATFSNVLSGVADTDTLMYRIKMDVDNGSSGWTCTLYSSPNDGISFISPVEVTDTGVTDINKNTDTEFNINGLNNSTSSTFTKEFKIHKLVMYNGLDDEYICLPVNIEEWGLISGYDNAIFDGTVPVFYIMNGSIGGQRYSYWDANKIAETTVPDEYQTFVINHGHNSQWDIGDVFYTEISDFVTRMKARLPTSTYVFLTQNPWTTGYTSESRKFTIPDKAKMTRRYAIDNGYGYIDSFTAIPIQCANWEDLMSDYVHPDPLAPATLYATMGMWLLNYMTGK